MNLISLNRNFFQRVLGFPATSKPADKTCWHYADGCLIIDLTKAPELSEIGGALHFEGRDLPKRVLVIFGETKKFHAFHNRCSHSAHRRLDLVAGTAKVQCCSMGKSTYDYSGKRVFGPARDPIKVFPVTHKENRLIIQLD